MGCWKSIVMSSFGWKRSLDKCLIIVIIIKLQTCQSLNLGHANERKRESSNNAQIFRVEEKKVSEPRVIEMEDMPYAEKVKEEPDANSETLLEKQKSPETNLERARRSANSNQSEEKPHPLLKRLLKEWPIADRVKIDPSDPNEVLLQQLMNIDKTSTLKPRKEKRKNKQRIKNPKGDMVQAGRLPQLENKFLMDADIDLMTQNKNVYSELLNGVEPPESLRVQGA